MTDTTDRARKANSTNTVEIRARAESVLAKCEDAKRLQRDLHRYRDVRVTIGEAEQLARDVLALLEPC